MSGGFIGDDLPDIDDKDYVKPDPFDYDAEPLEPDPDVDLDDIVPIFDVILGPVGIARAYMEPSKFPLPPRIKGLPPREPLSWGLRKMIFDRDGYRCRLCPSTVRLVIDHVLPRSRGGSDRSENLRVLCWDCNTERSDRPDPLDRWDRLQTPVAVACSLCRPDLPEYPHEDLERVYCYPCHRVGLASPWAIR